MQPQQQQQQQQQLMANQQGAQAYAQSSETLKAHANVLKVRPPLPTPHRACVADTEFRFRDASVWQDSPLRQVYFEPGTCGMPSIAYCVV
jgi:hypothetical protein